MKIFKIILCVILIVVLCFEVCYLDSFKLSQKCVVKDLERVESLLRVYNNPTDTNYSIEGIKDSRYWVAFIEKEYSMICNDNLSIPITYILENYTSKESFEEENQYKQIEDTEKYFIKEEDKNIVLSDLKDKIAVNYKGTDIKIIDIFELLTYNKNIRNQYMHFVVKDYNVKYNIVSVNLKNSVLGITKTIYFEHTLFGILKKVWVE